MGSTPISNCFYVMNGSSQMNKWNASIQELIDDEQKNPENISSDEKDINYYRRLEANLQETEQTAAAYRASYNDPNLAKQLTILDGRQQTLTQLVGLDEYIQSLKEDTKKNPQDASENAKKIANALAQEQCIQQFQSAWEAYQKSGASSDADKVNALVQELQQLREENPNGPYSSSLIWEDFQAVVSKYTVFEFDGQKYAVSPAFP